MVVDILIIKSMHTMNNVKFVNVQQAKDIYSYKNAKDAYLN